MTQLTYMQSITYLDLQSLSFNNNATDLAKVNFSSSKKMAETLDKRIKAKKRVAKSDIIDEIHRFAIQEHPVLTNRMYSKLLSQDLSTQEFEIFFNDYYHASCHGFFWIVLRQALNAHQDKTWRNYIKTMLAEESRPRMHCVILKEFIESCGFQIQEPVVAQQFIDSMVKGFTSDIPFALGYSLGVEVEGAYQIDLIEQSCKSKFSEQLAQTIWFEIHLDSSGEEEHANQAVDTIERTLNSESDLERLRQGFFQACDDTYNFMESLYQHIATVITATR
jgi:hypothetical protein